jgi:hypothetical protein
MNEQDTALVAAMRLAVRDRLTAAGARPPDDELATIFVHLLELARDRGASPVQRDAIGALVIELEALGSLAATTTAVHPVIARAVTLAGTRACRRMVELALELLGPDAQLARPNAPYDGLWPDLEQATRPAAAITAPGAHLARALVADEDDLAAAADHVTDVYLEGEAARIGALRMDVRARAGHAPAPAWDEIAEAGWTGVSAPAELGGLGLDFRAEAVVLEELARGLSAGPFFSTIGVLRPALAGDTLARVVAGTESWTLALTPLVSDLDTATHVAFVGGDGIFQLEGGEREVLVTHDATRPLGVVVGGDAGARIGESTLLPAIRTRTLAALAAEACGVGIRALELARETHGVPGELVCDVLLARALTYRAVALVADDDGSADPVNAAAKAKAVAAAIAAASRAGQGTEADRLTRRALWLDAWEATSGSLRGELAAAVLDGDA